jgi:3'(2'), 5'-bisphosphate nucleotidase
VASSALKFGLLARGDADIYPRFGPTCEWDTAAGQAIVEAAGGTVTALDGTPLVYGKAATKFLNGPFIARGGAPRASA